MSWCELVYIKNMKGGIEAQIWYGPHFVGSAEFMQKGTNESGQPLWGMFAENVIKRIRIKDGEEKLGIDKLIELYPLQEKK